MNKKTTQQSVNSSKLPIIMLIGVGGGGNNALNYMYKRGVKDVAFTVINTDAQALENSPVPIKLQIGPNLTKGLGAGANPEVGKNAALETKEGIKKLLGTHTKMVFITAGMGGGTGTGAAPVIASIAKKQGVLTVGIVTKPFAFEGKKKAEKAEKGICELKKHCDTVLIILNERIKEMHNNLSVSSAFSEADEVLATAAKSIAEVITVHGYVNVDFEDVKTVLQGAGTAVMGSGVAEGEERGLKAAEKALKSPLLDYKDIRGAQKILLSIVSGTQEELTMDELTYITNYVQEQGGNHAEMIFGHGYDPQLGEQIRITIIATGFNENSTLGVEKSKKSALFNSSRKHISSFKTAYTRPSTPATREVHQTNKKEHYLRERAQNLTESLKEGEKYSLSDEEIREKQAVPAYIRKNISLEYTPPTDTEPLRYHLYQDYLDV